MPFTTLDLSKQSGSSLPSSIVTASGLSTGKIIQIVSTKVTTTADISSTSFADVCSHSITPSATSSKVLVLMSGGRWGMYGGDSYQGYYQVIKTGGTVLMQGLQSTRNTGGNTTTGTISVSYLDSPSTTSSVTYTLQAKSTDSSKSVNIQNSDNPTSIVLMEVSA
jgi:hypothetical protein